jgi:hypothetical protein
MRNYDSGTILSTGKLLRPHVIDTSSAQHISYNKPLIVFNIASYGNPYRLPGGSR